MLKYFAGLIFLLTLTAACAFAEPVKHLQCYTVSELTELDKENVAGGKGTLHGEFAFIRDNARDEDAYLIVSGTGIFTDGAGNAYVVRPGDMTIARPGQWHGLANLNSEELVFLDIIAKNGAANLEAIKANPTPQYFPVEKLFDKNVEHAGGTGEGTLYGKFAFRREQATEDQANDAQARRLNRSPQA